MNLFAASDSEMEEEDVVDVTDEYMTAGSQGRRPEAGTLVVCPTAVLNQWATEIEDKVPLPFHNAWLSAKWLVTLLRFDLQNLCLSVQPCVRRKCVRAASPAHLRTCCVFSYFLDIRKVDSAAGITLTVYHGKDKIRDPEVRPRRSRPGKKRTLGFVSFSALGFLNPI